MWSHMGEYGWGGGMGFGMLLVWGVMIAGIVMLVKYTMGSSGTAEQEKSALEILKERYVRGEIEREEFEQKKRDLES